MTQGNKHFLGQIFTPPEVADFIVSSASEHLKSKHSGCDPACGKGVFLLSLLKHNFEPLGVEIDKNIVPEKLKKFVRIGNGLLLKEDNQFDLVVGNPPFSSKYGRVHGDILKNFELGKQTSSQAIEILFLEKFIKLSKADGVIGIILPHGIFSNLRLSYVRNYIRRHLSIIKIISLPRNIFEKTSSKTCILIGKKKKTDKRKIMFASVNSIDELSKGRKIYAPPEEFLYPEFYLEKNPKLDKLPKLKDFDVQIIQGSTKYGDERRFSSKGIPFISAKTITPFGIDFSKDEKYIEPDSIMDNKKAHVKIGDVVFVRVGVGCIGRAAVITKEDEKGIADDWTYIIRVRDDRLSPFCLAFWLQTSVIQKEIRRLARGVGTITIPIKLLKELPILIPPRNMLKECQERYQQFKDKKQQIKEEMCKKLENLIEKT